jgi:hypothetical protein
MMAIDQLRFGLNYKLRMMYRKQIFIQNSVSGSVLFALFTFFERRISDMFLVILKYKFTGHGS